MYIQYMFMYNIAKSGRTESFSFHVQFTLDCLMVLFGCFFYVKYSQHKKNKNNKHNIHSHIP